MTDVYKTPKYPNSNDCGCGYANKAIAELKNKRVYPLAEELSHIELLLPKDKIGTQPLSDESLDEMINSGEYDFFDIPELPFRLLNYKSKIIKSQRFSHK